VVGNAPTDRRFARLVLVHVATDRPIRRYWITLAVIRGCGRVYVPPGLHLLSQILPLTSRIISRWSLVAPSVAFLRPRWTSKKKAQRHNNEKDLLISHYTL